jgi:hypothetical protein
MDGTHCHRVLGNHGLWPEDLGQDSLRLLGDSGSEEFLMLRISGFERPDVPQESFAQG